MRQLAAHERVQPHKIPAAAQRHPDVLHGAKIEQWLLATIINYRSRFQVLQVVQQEETGEEHSQHSDQIQRQVQSVPAGIEYDHGEREQQLQHRPDVQETIGVNCPYEIVVKDVRVGRSHKQIKDHHQEEALVLVSNTARRKDAVMVALQDASITDIAVPGSGWSQGFAFGAESPHLKIATVGRGRSEVLAFDAGVGQDECDLVGEDVQQDEGSHGRVQVVLPGVEWIDGGQHDA